MHPASLANLRAPFQKGQPSANPRGRPKSIASLLKDKTHDSVLVADYLVNVITGVEKTAGHNQRLEASKLVLQYMHGSPLNTNANIEIQGGINEEMEEKLAAMDPRELEAIASAILKDQ